MHDTGHPDPLGHADDGASDAPSPVLMPSGWRHHIESAIGSLRYSAHPHRSPHADDLEQMLNDIDDAAARAVLAQPASSVKACPNAEHMGEHACKERGTRWRP